MTSAPALVKDRLHAATERLTGAERQVADALLRDYPMAGLESVTRLAERANVSGPTVLRLARKLGFDGFPEMQAALRAEMADQIKKPSLKLDARSGAEAGHVLHRFADAVAANIAGTLERLDLDRFDAIAAMLGDDTRPVFIAGGRITRTNAAYFHNHLQIIRPGVVELSPSPSVWPQYILDMGPGSVLVLFDIRRYEKDLQKLAQLAVERGADIVLFTDQWGSPIASIAAQVVNARVEAPSNWDSTLAVMLVIEALIAAVQARRWDASRERIEALEGMFSTTRVFRSFS